MVLSLVREQAGKVRDIEVEHHSNNENTTCITRIGPGVRDVAVIHTVDEAGIMRE